MICSHCDARRGDACLIEDRPGENAGGAWAVCLYRRFADRGERWWVNSVLPGSCPCGEPVDLIGKPSKGEAFVWVQPGTTEPCAHR